MAKKIVITSGKGGVGKTTVTANLGIFLSKLGFNVALIDVDFGLNNLDVVLGVENDVVFDMSDVINGKCRPKQALIEHKKYKNLFIMPSDKLKSFSNLTGQNIKIVIDSFSYCFDYILIDCPAGIDVGFYRAITCSDMALIVVTPTLSSIRDAAKVESILRSYKLDYVGTVINRMRGDLFVENKSISPFEIRNVLKTEIIGVLPEEDSVFLSSGKELPKKSDSFKAYKVLADNIAYGHKNIFDTTSKYLGFWGSIRRSVKKSV